MTSSKLVAIALGTLLGGAAMAQDTPAAGGAAAPSNTPAEPQPEGPSATESASTASTGLPGPQGFEVGLRLGYALPLGDLASGSSLSDATSGYVPIQLDLGYRFNPNWFAGAYFQYGFASVKDAVCGGASCSASDMRFGVEAQYHLMPTAQLDPWAGIGVGYEIFHLSASAGGASASENISGLEFVNFTVGGDYKIAPNLGVGPFIGLSVGQYSSAGDAGDITNKAVHMWLSFGVRAVFDVM